MQAVANDLNVPKKKNPLVKPLLIEGDQTYGTLTEQISTVVEGKTPRNWYIAFAVAFGGTAVMGAMLGYLVVTGVGVWGNNQPVGWAWDITNFVFSVSGTPVR